MGNSIKQNLEDDFKHLLARIASEEPKTYMHWKARPPKGGTRDGKPTEYVWRVNPNSDVDVPSDAQWLEEAYPPAAQPDPVQVAYEPGLEQAESSAIGAARTAGSTATPGDEDVNMASQPLPTSPGPVTGPSPTTGTADPAGDGIVMGQHPAGPGANDRPMSGMHQDLGGFAAFDGALFEELFVTGLPGAGPSRRWTDAQMLTAVQYGRLLEDVPANGDCLMHALLRTAGPFLHPAHGGQVNDVAALRKVLADQLQADLDAPPESRRFVHHLEPSVQYWVLEQQRLIKLGRPLTIPSRWT
jgi:hypothetical protein